MNILSNSKNYLVTLVILVIIDAIGLSLFINKRFDSMISTIQGEKMALKPTYFIVIYILLTIGITYFSVNRVDKNNALRSSIINGGLFGLVCYGVFDFTNMALFKNYELSTAIIDTVWGGILCASTTYISHLFLNNIFN